jgi:hypothetical protein
MKIAILGKGTTSIITTLVCLNRGHEVEIFYDPEQSAIRVGESTTPHIADLIWKTLNLSIGNLVDSNISSFKNGTRFIDWGETESFRHHFSNNVQAFNFNTNKFNDFIHRILKKRGVIYHPIRIDSYSYLLDEKKVLINDYKYDFLISCSGWKSTDEYVSPPLETVNTAILFKKEEIKDLTYTIHQATENGYQFEIPFPNENESHCGYLFNNKLTNSNEIFDAFKIKYPDCRKIEWTPKYCKKLIQSEFEAYNGNRLFFAEPLQALSLYNYQLFAYFICDYLDKKNYESFANINNQYLNQIHSYYETLSLHYQFGSKYKTIFWEMCQKESNKILSFNQNVLDENIFRQNIEYYVQTNGETNYTSIGQYSYPTTKDIYEGMKNISLFGLN